MGGRKQPAMLEGADFMQFSDATVSRRHFGIVFDKEVYMTVLLSLLCFASPSVIH